MLPIDYLRDEFSFTQEKRLSNKSKFEIYLSDMVLYHLHPETGVVCSLSKHDKGFEYRMCSDEAYTQGMAIGALATASIGDKELLDKLMLALQGATRHFVNGKGVRAWCPKDSECGKHALQQMKTSKDEDYKFFKEYEDCVAWEDFSTDQFVSLSCGLALAYMHGGKDARDFACGIATQMCNSVMGDGFRLRNPDGSKTRFGNCTGWDDSTGMIPTPEGLLPLLVCAWLSDEGMGTKNYEKVMEITSARWAVKLGLYDAHFEPISSCNNLFMHGMPIWCLWMLTGDSLYKNEWDWFYWWVKRQNNPLFAQLNYMIHKDAYSKEVVKRQLGYFPNDKRKIEADNSSLTEKGVKLMPWKNRYGFGVSEHGLPLSQQNIFFNTWTNDLRQVGMDNKGANGSLHWIGADYVFLYALSEFC